MTGKMAACPAKAFQLVAKPRFHPVPPADRCAPMPYDHTKILPRSVGRTDPKSLISCGHAVLTSRSPRRSYPSISTSTKGLPFSANSRSVRTGCGWSRKLFSYVS